MSFDEALRSLLCVTVLFLLGLLSGCTSVQVDSVGADHKMTHVCIEDNPKVIVAGFVSVIEEVFEDNLITTEIYNGQRPERCVFKLTYTAHPS